MRFPLFGFPLFKSFLFLPVPIFQLLFLRSGGDVFIKVESIPIGFVVGTLLRVCLLVELFFERLLQRNKLLEPAEPKRILPSTSVKTFLWFVSPLEI